MSIKPSGQKMGGCGGDAYLFLGSGSGELQLLTLVAQSSETLGMVHGRTL